jgi:hypothetical protein
MASLLPALLSYSLAPRDSSYNDKKNFRDSCTLETCPLSLSYWGYRPSLPANALFLALFALSTILFIGQGVLSRRFLGFTIAMVSGCALEVIGYVGRVMSHRNPFAEVCKPRMLVQLPVCFCGPLDVSSQTLKIHRLTKYCRIPSLYKLFA